MKHFFTIIILFIGYSATAQTFENLDTDEYYTEIVKIDENFIEPVIPNFQFLVNAIFPKTQISL
jgi:hypothetical protein